MGISSELIILFTAIGTVIFLFSMDYWFRMLEEKTQVNGATTKELPEKQPDAYLDVGEERDEPNIAA